MSRKKTKKIRRYTLLFTTAELAFMECLLRTDIVRMKPTKEQKLIAHAYAVLQKVVTAQTALSALLACSGTERAQVAAGAQKETTQ